MELTIEEKRLKEAMKIILRDGRAGRNYLAAKERYLELITLERIHNLAHELEGVDWTENYKKDIETITMLVSA